VDIAHPQYEDHVATVHQTLVDLGVADKPTLMVFNKIDLYRERNFDEFLDNQTKEDILLELSENLKNNYQQENIFISAVSKENVDVLKAKMKEMMESIYTDRAY
jgi:GTP-binding protein HflX